MSDIIKSENDNASKYDAAIAAIKASSEISSIYVGCDSQVFNIDGKKTKGSKKNGNEVKKKRIAKFSTVIILHQDSNHGARFIFRENVTLDDYGHLSPRLMQEVEYSVNAALAVKDAVGNRNFELHIDVNPNEMHASSAVVNQAIGYATAMLGFAPKIKPDSFAATHCSDHVVKSKLVKTASWDRKKMVRA